MENHFVDQRIRVNKKVYRWEPTKEKSADRGKCVDFVLANNFIQQIRGDLPGWCTKDQESHER